MPLEKSYTLKEYVLSKLHGQNGYRDFWAFKGVDFRVDRGEVMGVIDQDGSGKSTLPKLVAVYFDPADGTLVVNGSVSPLIELGAGFNTERTGPENVYRTGALLVEFSEPAERQSDR